MGDVGCDDSEVVDVDALELLVRPPAEDWGRPRADFSLASLMLS